MKMESLPKDRYLKERPNTLEVVRRDVNLHKPGEMKEAVRILDEWVKQQAHFRKKDFPPEFLEISIIMAKGSIERTKVMLDKMCTFRTMMPHYYGLWDDKEYENLKRKCSLVVLPELTEDHYRVVIARYVGKTSDPKIVNFGYRQAFATMDYLKRYDYSKGVILVYDLLESDILDTITNMNLFELRNCYLALLESYGLRIKRVHMMTASQLIEKLLSFFKQFLKKKIMDRITVHETIDELDKYGLQDILPKEYGGNNRSFYEVQEEYRAEISSEEYQQYLRSMSEARVDESLRPIAQFNDLYAGVYGTFRTLTLD